MKGILVIARALHLGYVGAYGNDWINTPALDRLAAEGIVFDHHYADCPDAAGARRAWRTGRYQFPPPNGEAESPTESVPDLFEVLHSHGIATTLVSDDRGPGGADFADGWERVVRATAAGQTTSLEQTLAAVDATLNRLRKQACWLLGIELSLLLPPWHVPDDVLALHFQESPDDEEDEADEEETEAPLAPLLKPTVGPLDEPEEETFLRLQRSYAAAVSHLDSGLEALLEEFDDRRLLDDAFVVVTADHGLALGEHGIVGPHRPWLHDELIHLPLIVRLPGGVEAGQRVFDLTQSVDLMPTLLDLFGLPLPDVHGGSLLPLMRGEPRPIRSYACAGLRMGAAVEWALRTPEWAYLLPVRAVADDPPRAVQLYVKPDDRWEVNNVLQHHLELGEHMEQVLRGFVEASSKPGPLGPPLLRDVAAEGAQTAATGAATPTEGEPS